MTDKMSHPLERASRALLGLSAVLFMMIMLSGCSSFRFAYSFADDVVESRAADYLDLDEDGKAELAKQTDALFAWHRTQMLPKYADFLLAQADIVDAGGWTQAQMAAAFRDFRGLVDETVRGASPFIADVLIKHAKPNKLMYLEARMTEQLIERRTDEQNETSEQSVDEWVERRTDWISRFIGDMTNEQVAIVRRYTESDMDDGLRWLENRQYRQAALITYLQTNPTRDQLADFIYRILMHGHEIVDPTYQKILERRWAMREAMYFEILTSLTPEQRQVLSTTLRDYARDMISLSEA